MEDVLFATLLRRLHLTVRRAVLDEIRAAGFEDVSLAHLYVFQLPGPDGLQPGRLAERMNMTKQATNHLLGSLEAAGYLERVPGGADGRTKVIRTTAKGRRLTQVMQRASRRLERQWAAQLGTDDLEALRRALLRLDAVVHAGTPNGGPPPAPAATATRRARVRTG